MNKQKITKFLQSFVAIPLFATSMQLTGVSALPSSTVVSNQVNNVAQVSAITTQEIEARKMDKENAAKIDQYFKSRNLPLEGYGAKFVKEARVNEIDPFLLPAIAMRESTGGKFACKKVTNSFFGWGSCNINFKSVDEAIEIVAKNLGGNNPNTDHYYDDKTDEQILRTYNRVIKNYPAQVMKIMKDMKSIEVTIDTANS